MKLYFTYGNETREGCKSIVPGTTYLDYADHSAEEICGENILEKVPNLVQFIDECHRLLPSGGKAIFSAPYFATANAWVSPLTVRGISESSLCFADKAWREANKFSEAFVRSDFQVEGQFAVFQDNENRHEEVRRFWTQRYLNTVQAILFTLTKR